MAVPLAGAKILASDLLDIFSTNTGAFTSFTPSLTQSNTPTKTSTCAYMKIGRLVIAEYHLAITSAGTANNGIVIGLPVNATGNSRAIGGFFFNDAGTQFYTGAFYLASASTMNMLTGNTSTGVMGATGGGFTAALASGDTIAGYAIYQAAS